jgi:hypothetical protein
MARGIANVRRDGRSVIERHQNAERRREQTIQNFRRQAANWTRNPSIVVNTTISELNRIDSQLAALRQRPIGQLSGAFRERNIDVQAMMQNDVDPRQFIGTWGDPLKNQITLDMANSLLRGRLDDYIDGDNDNDAYREAVIALNNARLEEAWMRTYAAEVGQSIEDVNRIAAEESEGLGYTITEEAVQAQLQQLITEANQIAQQIQQTGEAVPTQQAARILSSINEAVNPPAPSSPSAPAE